MMVGNSLDIFCLISTLISRFLGFDEMYPAGLWARNFEQLHYGITARMVWDHRHDFAMLAEILDMASNMMAYGPEKNRVFRGATGGSVNSDGVAGADAGSDTDEYNADDKFALVSSGRSFMTFFLCLKTLHKNVIQPVSTALAVVFRNSNITSRLTSDMLSSKSTSSRSSPTFCPMERPWQSHPMMSSTSTKISLMLSMLCMPLPLMLSRRTTLIVAKELRTAGVSQKSSLSCHAQFTENCSSTMGERLDGMG